MDRGKSCKAFATVEGAMALYAYARVGEPIEIEPGRFVPSAPIFDPEGLIIYEALFRESEILEAQT